MSNPRVLVVAAERDDLPAMPLAAKERDGVINTLGARVLSGQGVDHAAVFDAMTEEDFDVVWFISHGTASGIVLSSGILTAEMLSSMCRGSSLSLIMINTCDSESVAVSLYAATGIPVVCTIGETSDVIAYLTGKRFANLLKRGDDYATAFQKIRTRYFRMVPDLGTAWGEARTDSVLTPDTLRDLAMQVDRHDTLMQTLTESMDKLAVVMAAQASAHQETLGIQNRQIQETQRIQFVLVATVMALALAVVLMLAIYPRSW